MNTHLQFAAFTVAEYLQNLRPCGAEIREIEEVVANGYYDCV